MRNTITVKKTSDGGIIAELQIQNDNQILVILSGGNWEYDDPIQAENDEILELLCDARLKGIFVDFQSLDIVRVFS